MVIFKNSQNELEGEMYIQNGKGILCILDGLGNEIESLKNEKSPGIVPEEVLKFYIIFLFTVRILYNNWYCFIS